jgi:solute:Na+ symporter, SSS family
MGFGWIDWTVLAVYIAGTSWLADRLAGKKQTIRDFFLGGRRLPWQAVCGSIVASEISGVTFVSIPALAFAAKGNFTYMMFAMGSIIARAIIGYLFVPAFYRREIYSPYEFMGRELGPRVDRATTSIFLLGAFLAQGARLFLAALVLDTITGMGILWAIVLIGAISVVWTWLGGITSVVWTDVLQFVILFAGAVAALVAVIWAVPGGVGEIVRAGREAGKFQVFEFSLDRRLEFTFWTGLLGSTFFTLASHGTDQMMAQRLFCCRDAGEARKAIVASSVGLLLPLLMLTVGVGVYTYFRHHPPTAAQAAKIAERLDYAFPYFILNAMGTGMKGLLFAAIFSAATATGTLAAMAQTALSSFYLPFAKNRDEKHLLFVSRGFVLLAAVGLCAVAVLVRGMEQHRDLVRLALNMSAYTYGALLGTFLLAFLPLGRDARGLGWGIPLSILLVLAFNWQHVEWVRWAIGAAVVVLAAVAVPILAREPVALMWVFAIAALVIAVAFVQVADPDGRRGPIKLAFPWMLPIGTSVTLGLGVALGRKRLAVAAQPSVL